MSIDKILNMHVIHCPTKYIDFCFLKFKAHWFAHSFSFVPQSEDMFDQYCPCPLHRHLVAGRAHILGREKNPQMVTETADVDLAWHGNPARYPSISSPNSLPVTCVMSSKISPASARPSWILAWRTALQKGHFSTLVSLKHWITINQLNQKL